MLNRKAFIESTILKWVLALTLLVVLMVMIYKYSGGIGDTSRNIMDIFRFGGG